MIDRMVHQNAQDLIHKPMNFADVIKHSEVKRLSWII